MTQFLQQIINGLSLGSIYALIALGYTMVYGIIKLINFAHGDMYMLGAYIGFVAVTVMKLNFVFALVITMVATGLIGILIERIAYRPLRKSTRVVALITAIGVSFLLQNSVAKIMGVSIKGFPQDILPVQTWNIGGVVLNFKQVIIFATSIFLMVLLTIIVQKTKLGRAMRAVAVDADAARLMGINVDNIISMTFAIGTSLAAAAGILVGVYYNSIDPMMGVAPGLKAFVAAVFGGIGIIPGAMIGGFSIGITEVLISGYGSSMYKDAIVYGILILVLLLKPSGLLGKNRKEKV
ncbi:MAG: branched-chain amino acid ABC transporter permease [Erysipelotrichaceae bacterium]|nr:branched-chain amino acid ABC transporter permease [Erysipelotrichaceae bacterium]